MYQSRLLKVPPPFVVIAMAVIMFALNRFFPVMTWNASPWTFAGPVLGGLGVLILAISFFTFGKSHTTIDPVEPTNASTLVTHGIFSISRNPMYIGFLLMLLGWMTWLGSLSPILAVAFYFLYTNTFQISREEAALIEKFGDAYLNYKNKVPRWII